MPHNLYTSSLSTDNVAVEHSTTHPEAVAAVHVVRGVVAPDRDRAEVVGVVPAAAADNARGTRDRTGPFPYITHHIRHAIAIRPKRPDRRCTIGMIRAEIVGNAVIDSNSTAIIIAAVKIRDRLPFPAESRLIRQVTG